MRMKFIRYALLAIIGSTASSLNAQSSPTEEFEICRDLTQLHIEMEHLIRAISTRYQNDKRFINSFTIAQKRWSEYIAAQIAMKFPAADKHLEYGELYPMCRCLEELRLIRLRIEELSPWKNGEVPEEGCPGSVLVE